MFEVLNKKTSELLEECDVSTARASGPGGTKSDTSESAVKITHRPTGISVQSATTRSQQKNREIAVRKLRNRYARQIRHDVNPTDIGIPPALQDYVEDDLQMNPKNKWYPFLVKLVLDVFNAYDAQVSDTADFFDVSTGRLVKFLKNDSKLWKTVNELRESHGHHRLS